MNISEINNAITRGTFSNEDLTSIIEAVKYARARLGRHTIWSIKRGDKVSYKGRSGRIVVGVVTDIKIKNVIVQVGASSWRVPANMLTLVKEAEVA